MKTTLDLRRKQLIGLLVILMVTGSLFSSGCAQVPAGKWETIVTASDTEAGGVVFLNASVGVSICNASDNESGFFKYTNDGGKIWINSQEMPVIMTGLEMLDSQTIWSCGQGANVWRSLDGGKKWQKMADFGPLYVANQGMRGPAVKSLHCKYLSFADPQTGWIAGPRILGSTSDGGKSWQEMALPQGITDIDAIALRTLQEGYLLDVTGSGKLFITKDGGKTWRSVALNIKGEKIDNAALPMAVIRFSDAKTGLIVVARKGGQMWALHTQDGGESWSEEPVPAKIFGALVLGRDGRTLSITGLYGDIIVMQRR
jgi:photosystem II stability/assembly factor-like uncharacterized protein